MASRKPDSRTKQELKIATWLLEALKGKPMLTRKDVARHFGRSLATIDRWKRDGKLPRPVVVNGPMWKPSDLMGLEA